MSQIVEPEWSEVDAVLTCPCLGAFHNRSKLAGEVLVALTVRVPEQ
jgi:hypothetical protein